MTLVSAATAAGAYFCVIATAWLKASRLALRYCDANSFFSSHR
jgi:hypothetical protein